MRKNYARPALMTRQIWLLAAFSGVFATRFFWPGLACTLLMAIHQHERIFTNRSFAPVFLAGLLLSFGLGAGYAIWRDSPPPLPPRWALEASSPSAQHLLLEDNLAARKSRPHQIWQVADNRLMDNGGGPDKESSHRKGLRLTARVSGVEGRADRELRIILEDVRPADFEAAAWPGRVAFTWRDALTPEGERQPPPDIPFYLPRGVPGPALDSRPLPGQEVELELRLRRIHGLMNPGLWDIEAYWADRGVGLRAWEQGGNAGLVLGAGNGLAFKAAGWREALRQRVLAALPRDGGQYPGNGGYLRDGAELVPALLFGDKYLLDSRDAELFARSTLAHSLALSGLHLGYAATLGYFAVFLLYRLRPALALRLPRRKAALIGGAVPALAYLWLGGAPPSLLRAALMLAFVGWTLFRGRPLALADALIWAVAAILLWEPKAAFDLRLQLSALCIAALAWAGPLFARVNSGLKRPGFLWRLLRGAALLFLSSLVIQLALAPLLIKTFGLYGLAMPLNVLWLPVLGAAVMPCAFLGLLASALHLPALAEALFQGAALPCGVLLDLLRGMDSCGSLPALLPPRPHWLSLLGFCFLLSLAPWGKRGAGRVPKIILAVFLLVVPFLPPDPAGLRLHLLDVGQGQSVLLEWEGKRLLIDGGGPASPRFDVGREAAAASLAQNRLPRLDYMLASHLDTDHSGGLVFPLRHLRVDWYADNGGAVENAPAREIVRLLAEKGLERRVLRAEDALDLGGGLVLEVLHPALPRDEIPPDPNHDSLVLRLLWNGRGLALICGDVDKTAQRAMLRRLSPDALAAEALVLPHHGAASALLPEFYRAVGPRLALASAGYGNYWNFPSPAVKNALLEEKIPLLGTASFGRISLSWTGPGDNLRLSTARSGELSPPP